MKWFHHKNSIAGVPSLQDLMLDDLRWNWCNNNRNKVHNKCNVFKLSPNHSPNPSTPTLVHGKIVSHKTGPSRVPVCVGACIGFHSGETGTAGRVWEEAWEDVTNVSKSCSGCLCRRAQVEQEEKHMASQFRRQLQLSGEGSWGLGPVWLWRRWREEGRF